MADLRAGETQVIGVNDHDEALTSGVNPVIVG